MTNVLNRADELVMSLIPEDVPQGYGQVLAHRWCMWFALAIAAYVPMVYVVGRWVREGKIRVNAGLLRFLTFSYNLVAGVLSGIGFYVMYKDPIVMRPSAWYPEATMTSATRFVVIVFCFSKPFEFIDTFLTKALKGREPKFIAVFHHVVTAIVAYFALHSNCHYQHNPTVMNLFVHAVMFTYFALIEYMPSGPKRALKRVARLPITLIQVIQMFIGFYAQYVVTVDKTYEQTAAQWDLAAFGVAVYGSYIYLFGKFFVTEYMLPSKKVKKVKRG